METEVEMRPPAALRAYKVYENLLARCSKVGDSPFPNIERFPWREELEKGWPDVRRELEALLSSNTPLPGLEEIAPNQGSLTSDKMWKAYFFVALGRKFTKNIERCPKTWELIRKIPRIETALFSLLEPGKILTPHKGPYKGLLRCHLAVLVPSPNELCSITVDGHTFHWTEGKTAIFDDTFLHHAENNSTERRVVLFIDFARPLSFPLNMINWLFLRAFSCAGYMRRAYKAIDRWGEAHVRSASPPSGEAAQPHQPSH